MWSMSKKINKIAKKKLANKMKDPKRMDIYQEVKSKQLIIQEKHQNKRNFNKIPRKKQQ